jgi:ketosteroid isomerase-like protein
LCGAAYHGTVDPMSARMPIETTQDKLAFYAGCAAATGRGWDEAGLFYAEDATSTFFDSGKPTLEGRAAIVEMYSGATKIASNLKNAPQFNVLGGNRLAVVNMSSGLQAATGKPWSYIGFHQVEFGPHGYAHDWHALNHLAVVGQIGATQLPHRPQLSPAVLERPADAVVSDEKIAKSPNIDRFLASLRALQSRDLDSLAAFWAPDATVIDTMLPADMTGAETAKHQADVVAAFADIEADPFDVWAAGDCVVAMTRLKATNVGPLAVIGLAKPTGERFELVRCDVMRFRDGKVYKQWSFGRVAAQLGMFPPR